MESNIIVFSSIVRIPQGIIELLGHIYKKPMQELMDTGSTSNYINEKIINVYNLIVQNEEGAKQLTLADGTKVQALGYNLFCL